MPKPAAKPARKLAGRPAECHRHEMPAAVRETERRAGSMCFRCRRPKPFRPGGSWYCEECDRHVKAALAAERGGA